MISVFPLSSAIYLIVYLYALKCMRSVNLASCNLKKIHSSSYYTLHLCSARKQKTRGWFLLCITVVLLFTLSTFCMIYHIFAYFNQLAGINFGDGDTFDYRRKNRHTHAYYYMDVYAVILVDAIEVCTPS